jgi:hypothetical protein
MFLLLVLVKENEEMQIEPLRKLGLSRSEGAPSNLRKQEEGQIAGIAGKCRLF